jgi:hypothetical protein
MHSHASNNAISRKNQLFCWITETELTEVVHSLKSNKSVRLADISSCLLKKCMPYMLKPLSELVSASITEGIFPSTLKENSS